MGPSSWWGLVGGEFLDGREKHSNVYIVAMKMKLMGSGWGLGQTSVDSVFQGFISYQYIDLFCGGMGGLLAY